MDRLSKLHLLKKELEKRGFFILGIVGSFARGEDYKDIDIVYETNEMFEKNYKGWEYFIELENIKNYLQKALGKKVDLVNFSSMNSIAKKYMMQDFKSV